MRVIKLEFIAFYKFYATAAKTCPTADGSYYIIGTAEKTVADGELVVFKINEMIKTITA